MAMAKPMLDAATLSLLRATAVLMPMTSPAALTRAPPELPELMAASVWIRPSSDPVSVAMDRSSGGHDALGDGEAAFEGEGVADRDGVVTDRDR